jgi:hypothetical protein
MYGIIESIKRPRCDSSGSIPDAILLQGLVQRHGYDAIIDAVRTLRTVNGDNDQRRHVGTRFLDMVDGADQSPVCTCHPVAADGKVWHHRDCKSGVAQ